MSEDICGHPTADGSPCENPASDGDSCWIPAHGGSADNHGRDFLLSEADHEDILEAARLGMSKAGCARAAGTGPDQLQRYLDAEENADFRDTFMRARHQGERRLIEGPLESHEDDPIEMDGQHARFLLSTSFDYIKTEKRELTGDDGGAIEVQISEDVAATWPDETS